MLVRVRIRFSSTPLHYAQKCWFTFDADKCRLVGDVAHLISSHFGLGNHTTTSILLYMDDFLVPTNESSEIIRDNDLLEVKVLDCVNGLQQSNSPSSPSSPELQPPRKKRKPHSPKKTKVRKEGKAASPSSSTSMKPPVKSKAVNLQPPSKPTSITPHKTDKLKPLHSKQTKTASGGVHLIFHDSSSSSSERSSEISRSNNNKTSNATSSKPVMSPLPSTVVAIKQFSDPVNHIARPTGSLATRGKTRGCGKKSRRRQSLPSNLVVGGPEDIHTTQSTLYKKSATTKPVESVGPILTPNYQPVQPVCSESVTMVTTGWDIKPKEVNSILQSSVEAPHKDYSDLPDLSGAPRIGDCLAFKLLELSGSCTPEVSDYREGLVLAYDVISKTLRIKYKVGPKPDSLEAGCTSRLARFALEQELESVAQDVTGIQLDEVQLDFEALISPKLVVPCKPMICS